MPQAALLILGYALVCGAGGLGFDLLVGSIAPLPARELCAVVGGVNVATVVGIVALIFPAGLGVREAVLLAILRPAFGTPAIAWAAVAYRVLTLLTDLVFFTLVEGLAAVRAPTHEKAGHPGSDPHQSHSPP